MWHRFCSYVKCRLSAGSGQHGQQGHWAELNNEVDTTSKQSDTEQQTFHVPNGGTAPVWDTSHRNEMVFVLDSKDDRKNTRDAQEPKPLSSSRVVGQLWNSNPFDDDLIGTFEIDFRGVAAFMKANDVLSHKAWYVLIQCPSRASDAVFESFELKYFSFAFLCCTGFQSTQEVLSSVQLRSQSLRSDSCSM